MLADREAQLVQRKVDKFLIIFKFLPQTNLEQTWNKTMSETDLSLELSPDVFKPLFLKRYKERKMQYKNLFSVEHHGNSCHGNTLIVAMVTHE